LEESDDSTLFHIRKADNHSAKFEYFSYDGTGFKDKTKIADTYLKIGDIRAVCKKVTDDYEFHLIKHNCQNWCDLVLKQLNLHSPVKPANEKCGCLYMVQLLSSSSTSVGPNDKVQK